MIDTVRTVLFDLWVQLLDRLGLLWWADHINPFAEDPAWLA
jgi:hypothetical protein